MHTTGMLLVDGIKLRKSVEHKIFSMARVKIMIELYNLEKSALRAKMVYELSLQKGRKTNTANSESLSHPPTQGDQIIPNCTRCRQVNISLIVQIT